MNSKQPRKPTDWNAGEMQRRIRGRYRAERRFKFYGMFAVLLSAGFPVFLLVTIVSDGARGFTQTEIEVPVNFAASDIFLDPAALTGDAKAQALAGTDFDGLVRQSAIAAYGADGADLVSPGAWLRVRDAVADDPDLLTGAKYF